MIAELFVTKKIHTINWDRLAFIHIDSLRDAAN